MTEREQTSDSNPVPLETLREVVRQFAFLFRAMMSIMT